MGVRVECDWCKQVISAGSAYVTIEVDGKIVEGHHANAPKDVSGPARVYCGQDRYEDDDPAANGYTVRDNNGWQHRTSCAQRVLAALDGNPSGRADMGLEWRLVPQVAPHAEYLIDGAIGDLDLDERILRALRGAGLDRIRPLAELTEAQWLSIRGIGRPGVTKIRQALHSHPKKAAKQAPKKAVETVTS